MPLSEEIKKNFECMRVVSAGSGTVFETRDRDGDTAHANYDICLNTKSGHYRPSLKDVDFAKSLLGKIIQKMDIRDRIKVSSQYKSSKQTIRNVFGDSAESKVGICIPKNKI